MKKKGKEMANEDTSKPKDNTKTPSPIKKMSRDLLRLREEHEAIHSHLSAQIQEEEEAGFWTHVNEELSALEKMRKKLEEEDGSLV